MSSRDKEFLYIFFIILLLGLNVWGSQVKLARAEVYVCNYNIVGNSGTPIKPLCEYKGNSVMMKKEIEQYERNGTLVSVEQIGQLIEKIKSTR